MEDSQEVPSNITNMQNWKDAQESQAQQDQAPNEPIERPPVYQTKEDHTADEHIMARDFAAMYDEGQRDGRVTTRDVLGQLARGGVSAAFTWLRIMSKLTGEATKALEGRSFGSGLDPSKLSPKIFGSNIYDRRDALRRATNAQKAEIARANTLPNEGMQKEALKRVAAQMQDQQKTAA